MEWTLSDYHSSTYRLANLLRISSNKYIYTAKRDRLNISYQNRIPMVDSISQSIHPTGNTTIPEKSSVQPKGLYRDMGPLAGAVSSTIARDEKQRFLAGTTGGGRVRLTRAFFFCIGLWGRTVNFEAMRCSTYEVARYQVLCYNDERTTRELMAEARQTWSNRKP